MSGWFLATAATASAIPFRQESATAGAASLSGALLIAVAMLSVVAAVAWYARRRGWLDRWVGPTPSPRAQLLQVEQALRLSPQTTLYRVRHEGQVLLVIESRVNARVERTANHDGFADEA